MSPFFGESQGNRNEILEVNEEHRSCRSAQRTYNDHQNGQ